MKLTHVLVVAAALGGCKKTDAPPPQVKTIAQVAAMPAQVVAPIDGKTLDDAIAKQGIKPAVVKQRAIGAHSAWALFEAPRSPDGDVIEYDLLRVTAAGPAVVPLTPTARKTRTWWNSDTTPLDVRDLDGDGTDECLVVLEWYQTIDVGTGESAKQLYIIGGAKAAVAATAIVDYQTQSQQQTAHDTTEPPPPEHVAFDWKAAGKTLTVTRTTNTLNGKRAAGLTDPATDPLMAGGAIPIAL